MTQQDTEKTDLLTIDELAEHAMAEAAKEAADGKDGVTPDDGGADDALIAKPGDADSKKSRKGNKKAEVGDDKAEETDDKPEEDDDNTEEGDDRPQKSEKDSLKERLRQYVDDDDAPPPSFKISLKAIIGGDGLSKVVARNWVFILVIVFFTCCYVTSRYMMQGAAIEHTNLNKQLEDRKIKALTITSEYLEKTRKEYIKESLADTTLHSTVEIPYSLPLN